MVLQFEDCVDVVKVLYPQYDYIFLFDHSCGHDRKRPDGLCVNSIRKNFGGKQAIMSETKLETEEYFGPFSEDNELTLQIGDTQRMVFWSTDPGPYWMSIAERETNRYHRPTGKTIKRFRNKSDLLRDLQAKGVSGKGRKDELQILCKNQDVPIEEEHEEVVEGWEGKPKGMLQIL